MPTDTDPTFLCLGCGNQHNADPAWLFHDLIKHHQNVRLSADLESVLPHSFIGRDPMGDFRVAADLGKFFGYRPVLFKLATARDVLEHIAPNKFFTVMQFIWNCMAPGGELNIQVPQWGSQNAIVDPTHYRGFHLSSFDILDPTTRLGRKNKFYGSGAWQVLERKVVPDSDVNLSFVLRKVA